MVAMKVSMVAVTVVVMEVAMDGGLRGGCHACHVYSAWVLIALANQGGGIRIRVCDPIR